MDELFLNRASEKMSGKRRDDESKNNFWKVWWLIFQGTCLSCRASRRMHMDMFFAARDELA